MRRRDPAAAAASAGGVRSCGTAALRCASREDLADVARHRASERRAEVVIRMTTAATLQSDRRSRPWPLRRVRCHAVIVNALTIDVEDYFQVSAFEPQHPAQRLGRAALPRRGEHRPHPWPARRARYAGDVLHAGLDRASAIRRWSAGSPRRATSSRATATSTSRASEQATRRLPRPTSVYAKALLEDSARASRCAAIVHRASPSGPRTRGRSTA